MNDKQPSTHNNKKMATKSLKAKGNDLAVSNKQLEILNGGIFADGELP